MRCRSCRQDNPVGARFCVACGTRLAIVCAACGVELPEGARFCPACGGAVEPTRPTVAPAHAPDAYTPRHLAERILTSRAGARGRAQAGDRPVLRRGAAPPRSPSGWAPSAMHDAPQPLLRAGRWPRSTATRAPSTSSSATASWRSSARRWRTRITRAAPRWPRSASRRGGRAARWCSSSGARCRSACAWGSHRARRRRRHRRQPADGLHRRRRHHASGGPAAAERRPGTILVSEATARLIEGHVALEPSATLDVRGLSGPVSGVPAHRSAAAVGAGAARGAAACGAASSGASARRPPCASCIGEVERGSRPRGGSGRRARGGQVASAPGVRGGRRRAARTWLEGRCLSYGSAIPYLPILDLVRGVCGIADDRSARARRREGPRHAARRSGSTRSSAPRSCSAARARRSPTSTRRARWAARSLAARTLDTLRQVWLREQPSASARPRRRGRALDRPRLRGVPGGPRRGPGPGAACCW